MLLAYWGLVLMSIHAGTHMTAAFSKLKKNRKNIYLPVVFLLTVIAIYGIYAFFRRGFPGYMFIKTIFAFFDFSEPRIFFIADYISIIILFGAIGYLIWNGLEKLPKGSQLKLD